MTPEFAAAQAAGDGQPRVVLDTNVVLDWLLFKDARFALLARHLEQGSVTAVGSLRMRTELHHMLMHASLARYEPDSERMLSTWDQTVVLRPAAACTTALLHCRDADDQTFIDLALHEPARWLVTRDKDLLSLARRAHKHGLAIITPEAWSGP